MKTTITLLLLPFFLSAKGLIVNEVSNGTSGTKEFIEFLVVGSSSNPLGKVDINGWIFDDNNGEFDASSSSGVSTGHYRFINMPLLNVGDIIVVYNVGNVNGNMIPDDVNDSNSDGVYVIPINHTTLERCSSQPSTINTSYVGSVYSYSPSQTWGCIGLRNGGDAVQVRMPDYTFFHGFSYGDVTTNFPSFPPVYGGGSSFNVSSGSGSSKSYVLECSDWTDASNYSKINASGDSPAYPNSTNNELMINNIKMGTFDYLDLSNPTNCQDVTFDINEINLRVIRDGNDNLIVWEMCDDYEYFDVQISIDAISFSNLDVADCGYTHKNAFGNLYYRLVGYNINGDVEYSKIVNINSNNFSDVIYPNPTTDYLNTQLDIESYEIISFDGKVIKVGNESPIDVNDLKSGFYIISIKGEYFTQRIKFRKI